jgi:hypothetical protein
MFHHHVNTSIVRVCTIYTQNMMQYVLMLYVLVPSFLNTVVINLAEYMCTAEDIMPVITILQRQH